MSSSTDVMRPRCFSLALLLMAWLEQGRGATEGRVARYSADLMSEVLEETCGFFIGEAYSSAGSRGGTHTGGVCGGHDACVHTKTCAPQHV